MPTRLSICFANDKDDEQDQLSHQVVECDEVYVPLGVSVA